MALTTNRGNVRTKLREYSQRRNISDATMNTFIELAQSKANRALRIPPLESYTIASVDENGYFDIPADYIEAKELRVTRNNQTIVLDRKSINEVNTVFTRERGGCPRIFGRFGTSFRIAPWDNPEDDEVILYYYYALPELTNDTDTNWFTQFAVEILIYGGMAELSNYIRDEEGAARWTSQANEAINILQSMEDRSAWSGNSPSISLGGST